MDQERANEKGSMNPSSSEQVETGTENVLSLFGKFSEEIIMYDPLSELIEESNIEETPSKARTKKARRVVNENQFPDQSIYVLSEQLRNLKSTIGRMKFYLGDLEDILPSRNL